MRHEQWVDGVLVSTEQVDDDTPPVDAGDDATARLVAAEQARRDAYDAVLAGKTRTLALVDQATRAGSDAFLAALQ